MCTILSLGNDACRYALGTSKVCTALPSWVSIIKDTNSDSSVMASDVASSRGIYICWGLLSVHTPPLILPYLFYLMLFMDRCALYFSCQDMSAGYSGLKTAKLCNCLYLLSIATAAIFPCVLMPPHPHPYGRNMC